jgi:hypothetical protein
MSGLKIIIIATGAATALHVGTNATASSPRVAIV